MTADLPRRVSGHQVRMSGITSLARRCCRTVHLDLLVCCSVLIVASGCSDDGDAASTTTASVTTTTTERTSTTTTERTSTTTEPPPAAGSLASATVAIRAACRELYSSNPANVEERLTSEELAAQCDEPAAVEWRSDCYHVRPAHFVPGDGGCAHLGGYLAVFYGRQPYEGGDVFEVGDDEWHVIPESD